MGVVKHRLFWPIAALLTLVVINTLARPQFIKVTVRDGQLYGALIDILRNSAPLMLVALGMTIVIATRGIDLSVGAVMAVSGAVALTIIHDSGNPDNLGTVVSAVVVALLVALVLGSWNGMLIAVLGIQPIIATLVLMLAGRGVALLITEGFITTVNSGPFEYIATGYLLILPFAFLISLTAILVIGAFERRTALGMLTEAVGINPEASRLAGVRSRGIIFSVYVVSGLMAGIAGVIYSSNIRAADANAAGLFIELYAILAVVLGGTSLQGRQVQHRRHGDRRPDHPDAELDHPVPRRPLGAEPGVLRVGGGARGHRPVAACSPARTTASWRDRIRWHGRQACEGGGWGMTTTETTESTRSSPKQADDRFINRHASLMPTFAALGVLVVLLIAAQLYFGDFVSPGNMSALLLDNAYLMVIAVGMTFVILTAGIDLSVGSVMAFTGILLASLLGRGMPAAVAVPVILLAGAVIGLLIGILVQYFDVQPFIASLAGLFLARGLAFVVSLKSIRVDDPAVLWLQSTRFQVGDWYITPTGIIALLAVGIGAFVLQYTRFGRTVYAIGGNEQSARLMGLKVARTKVFVYLISGSLAGLAGLILTAYSGAGYPRNGIGTELDAIAAVVIGGTLLSGGRGYVLGSMIGVLVYGTIKTVISFLGAEQAWMQIIVGGLLLLFILIQRFIVSRSERRE